MRRGLALGVVIGVALAAGGAFAAGRYLITSVQQIKPSVRTALRGAQGPAGPQGPAGVASEFEVTGTSATISPGSPANTSTAVCPSGDLVLSGGWRGLGPDATVDDNEPTTVNDQQGWAVIASLNPSAGSEEVFQAVALCAGSG